MKSQSWNNFTPQTTRVVKFIGGVRGWTEGHDVNGANIANLAWEEINSTSSLFGAISYELRVSEDHNGWHHMLAMYGHGGGSSSVGFANAILKETVRPGVYQFLLHFQYPVPRNGWRAGASTSFFPTPPAGGISQSYLAQSFGGENGTGVLFDMFVARPTMVNPSNIDDFVELWDANIYSGRQPVTGFPVTMPEFNPIF